MLETLLEHLGHIVHRTLPTLGKHLVSERSLLWPRALLTWRECHQISSLCLFGADLPRLCMVPWVCGSVGVMFAFQHLVPVLCKDVRGMLPRACVAVRCRCSSCRAPCTQWLC